MKNRFTLTIVKPQKELSLTSSCKISQPFDPGTQKPPYPKANDYNAIWDTGATYCAITQKVVDELGLNIKRPVITNTANGERNTYAGMPESKESAALGIEEKEELKKAFRDNISYVYPYTLDTVLPAKLSVSALKQEGELEIGSRVPYIAEKPSFIRKGSFSGAEAGTLTHRFLQYMDINADWSDVASEVARQIDQMVLRDILSADEAGVINKSGIIDFLMSGLGQKILTADRIEREKEFIMAVAPALIDKAWKGATGEILIQGKIDLIFFKDGESGIVDYKTDSFRDDEHFRSINATYTRQINVYAAAFERLYGTSPDGLYIAYLREGVNEKAERTGFGA